MSMDQFEEAKEANQKWKYSNERTSESWRKVEATAIWDQACKRSSNDRTCSFWLACLFLSNPTCFSPTPSESVINKRKSSCHFAWRNGSIAAWMFVHPTNTAVILDLKGFLINQKLFLSTSEYHHYYQGRMWNMPDFWNRHNNSLFIKRPSHGKVKLANLCWQTQVDMCEKHKNSRKTSWQTVGNK